MFHVGEEEGKREEEKRGGVDRRKGDGSRDEKREGGGEWYPPY